MTDPQRAPYCFWRTYYTPQELENKVVTDGWDEDFVEYVIEKYRGVNIDSIEREQEGRRSLSPDHTIEVVCWFTIQADKGIPVLMRQGILLWNLG